MEDTVSLHVPIVVSAVRWEDARGGVVPSGAVCGGRDFDNNPVYIGRTRLRENRNELTPGVVIPNLGELIVSYGTGVRKSKEYEVLVTHDPGAVAWVPCRNGEVPPNAVIGGIDCSYLEPLYIGKTRGKLSLGRTWRGQRFPNQVKNAPQGENLDDSTFATHRPSETLGGRPFNLLISSESGQQEKAAIGDAYQNFDVSFPGKVHRTHKCLYIPYNDKEYLFRDYDVLTLTTTPESLGTICKWVIRGHLLTTMNRFNSASPTLVSSNATLTEDSDDDVEKILSQKLDSLPLPFKLREFCKQGME